MLLLSEESQDSVRLCIFETRLGPGVPLDTRSASPSTTSGRSACTAAA